MKTQKFWTGSAPHHCDICGEILSTAFVDGKWQGRAWANMCVECHGGSQGGGQLGLGIGQKYEKQEDGRWLKTGG
jgi:hypothetical protein